MRHRLIVLLLAVACTSHSSNQPIPLQRDCSAPQREAIAQINVPGPPFQALPSADGCWIFVSITREGAGSTAKTGIAVLNNVGGAFALDHFVSIDPPPTGMALTHDGQLLVAASGPAITFIDVDRLIADRGSVAGRIRDGALGHIYAGVTADDRYAFVASEGSASITVIDLAKARTNGFAASSIVGQISTGRAPIAVTLSPDDKTLYTTSELAPANAGWPAECRREGSAPGTAPSLPQGAIITVDVARAERDPTNSVLSTVRAGCSPVRLVLSPGGDVAYVSTRGDDALAVYDTRKLVADPANARIATVPVGTAPVGVAVVDAGARIVVTNSNRFGSAGSGGANQKLDVVDAGRLADGAGAVVGSIPAGAFPREMRLTANGRTLVLTNYTSRTVEIIDVARTIKAP